MAEIKVQPGKVEPVLKSLKARTQELETSNPSPDFAESTLNFIKKIQSIEEKYYQTLNAYKTALIGVEEDIETKIQAYVETDQRVAQQVGPQAIRV